MKPSSEGKILKAITELSEQMDSKIHHVIAALSKSTDAKFDAMNDKFDHLLGTISAAFREQDEKIDAIKLQSDAMMEILDLSVTNTKLTESERSANISAHARFEKHISALEKNRAT